MNRRARSLPGPLRDLPIFWKLLLPFLALLLAVGAIGVYVIVHDLGSRSAAALEEQLTLRAVDARSLVHDSELDLLESANYASNLQGMSDAVSSGASDTAGGLLQSVLALKTNVDLVAVTTPAGVSVVQYTRVGPSSAPVAGEATDWSVFEPMRTAIDQHGSSKAAGFVHLADRTLMIMVAPVCSGTVACDPSGFAIVGADATRIAERLAAAAADARRGGESVTLFDEQGQVLASTGDSPTPPRLFTSGGDIQQTETERSGHHIATAYTQFTLAGRPSGTVAVTIPASSTFSTVSGSALRLVALLVLAMLVAVAVGAALSRWVLRQLRAVVETSRDLGSGDFSARAPVLSSDEHGELAAALNRMAEQLQAEHDTLELQVEERTEEIKRLLRDRTEFFAGLSHELRTPLAVIATQAEMLLADGDTTGPAGEAGTTIRESAAQLLELVNDILDLARSEAGSIDVHLEPVQIGDVVASLEGMLVRLGAAAGVTVRMEFPQRLPIVAADPARLHEILVNLVSNAIKYTPDGGHVIVRASVRHGLVEVSVSDTGVGIPPTVGDRVFDPFYRVPGSSPQRGQPSSGLGLALTRRYVEALGGTITWAPNGTLGTVFTFTLRLDGTTARTNGHAAAEQRSVVVPSVPTPHEPVPSRRRDRASAPTR